MSPRTLLLSVDGSLLVEIDSPERAYAADREGRTHEPLEVPPDARELQLAGPGGRGPYYFRPAAITALRHLADTGVDIVWNTRWLAFPPSLSGLAHALGLEDAVRAPGSDELPVVPVDLRIDHGPNVFWEHWKVRALVQRVRDLPEDAELVVIDTHLDFSSRRLSDGVARRSGREHQRLGSITPHDRYGIVAHAITALRSWADGKDLPRI